VGFHVAALANVADAHPTACACTPQLVPASNMASLPAAHKKRSCSPSTQRLWSSFTSA